MRVKEIKKSGIQRFLGGGGNLATRKLQKNTFGQKREREKKIKIK